MIESYLGLDIGSKGARYAITSDNQTFERGDITVSMLGSLFRERQIVAASCEYTGRLGRAWAEKVVELGSKCYFIHTVERRAINRLQGQANKDDDRDAIGIAGMLYLWAHEGRRSALGLAGHLFIDASAVEKRSSGSVQR